MDRSERVAMFESTGRLTTFARGDVLLNQGASGDSCFGLVSGEVLATTSSSSGAEVVLGRRGPGDIVGQLSMLDGSPRSARVVARTEVTAQRLTAAELERLFGEHPAFAMDEMRRLGAEVRSLTRRITGRSEELRVRVVDLLQLQAEVTGDVVFRSTRDELAGWVGATREAVSRALSDLADDGTVELGRGEVRLLA